MNAENWDDETAIESLSGTHLLQPRRDGNDQLSFVSKYLHWCVNNAFPIWDQYSRMAMGQKESKSSWKLYKAWARLIREKAADHSTCCLKELQGENESLIRTLDKALYAIGRHADFVRELDSAILQVRRASEAPANVEVAAVLANGQEMLKAIHEELQGNPQAQWHPSFDLYVSEHSRINLNQELRKEAVKPRKRIVNIGKDYLQLSSSLFDCLLKAGNMGL